MADKAFRLGNMCDDLVELTIEMCGKDEDKCPRFPKWSYATLVDRIMNTALDIQEQVIEANEHELGETRAGMQKTAAAKCIYLNHLIRIAWQRGYISLKQHDRWAKLVTDIKWKTVNWYQSDMSR